MEEVQKRMLIIIYVIHVTMFVICTCFKYKLIILHTTIFVLWNDPIFIMCKSSWN